jgi:hypothetical protein
MIDPAYVGLALAKKIDRLLLARVASAYQHGGPGLPAAMSPMKVEYRDGKIIASVMMSA